MFQYVGTLDSACDHFAQEKWTHELVWSGQESFVAQETEDWVVNGKVAGTSKGNGGLKVSCGADGSAHHRRAESRQLLKVYGAGHLVPHDKPEVSF